MKVCIDAGHGGDDPGAESARGHAEKSYTLTQALVAESILTHAGHELVLTRRSDEYVGLSERARIANEAGADVFVSIHFNASTSEEPSGTQVLYWKSSEDARRLAEALLEEVAPLDEDDRERWERTIAVPDSNFRDGMEPTVLKRTRMPAVILETEFGTDPEAAVLLEDPDYVVAVAQGVAKAIEGYES